jgi:hypothetical protein
MRYMKWIGLAAALLLIVSCFSPWVFIESRNITVSGIDTTGTNFGKPGYFHFIMTGFFLLFNFVQKVGFKRANLLIAALNLGWAIRNYFIISVCMGGDCPIKKTGIYLMLLASILMMLSALFPDMKPPQTPHKEGL